LLVVRRMPLQGHSYKSTNLESATMKRTGRRLWTCQSLVCVDTATSVNPFRNNRVTSALILTVFISLSIYVAITINAV